MNKLNKQAVLFKLAALACLIAIALASAAYANEYFNPELIELDNPGMKGADLSAFESGSQLPGTYRVDVLIGGQIVDTREIKFDAVKNAEGETTLQPCLSVAQLNSWGIKTGLFPDLRSGGMCKAIGDPSGFHRARFQCTATGDRYSTGGAVSAGTRIRAARNVG